MESKTNIKYKPSTLKALQYMLLPALELSVSLFLLNNVSHLAGYLIGQAVLALFFFQCFVLLHECGHWSFFKSRRVNKLFGNLMGFVSIIPFTSWVQIHNLHHKWTGFRDKDPTTEGTVKPVFSGPVKLLVNACWLLYIPLFTLAYRFGNYWNVKKMKKHLKGFKLNGIFLNMFIQMLLYGVLVYFFGNVMLKFILPAYLLSLMLSDLIILSQHSYIEIPIAGDKEVRPIKYMDQVPYTRSLEFPSFVSKFIFFNFNRHEAHHAYPSLPAYYLDKANCTTRNSLGFFTYLKKMKSMSGMKFVFDTEKREGKS